MPKYIYGETIVDLPDEPNERAQIVTTLDIDEYHDMGDFRKHGKNVVWSKSQLSELIDCPQKFYYKYIRPLDPDEAADEEKDHFNIGNAVHTKALEPDLFDARFYVIPDGIKRDKRTQVYKDCIAEANGRKMIVAKGNKNTAGYDDVKGMAKALVGNKKAISLLDGSGKVEPSIFWTDPDTGLKLRCRPDWLGDNSLVVDLKTGQSAHPQLFAKHAFDFHYDVSAAMTTEGVTRLLGRRPDNYVFLVIESKPPYVIEAYDSFRPWDADDMSKFTYFDAGSYRYRKALDTLAECLKTGIWPGYNTLITPMSVPGYAMKQLEKGNK